MGMSGQEVAVRFALTEALRTMSPAQLADLAGRAVRNACGTPGAGVAQAGRSLPAGLHGVPGAGDARTGRSGQVHSE